MNSEQKDTSLDTNRKNPVIKIQNLRKSFDNQVVLNGISLDLFEGENLVILGKSGSGKSVLIKCIVGLLLSDGGSITVLEQNIQTINRIELDILRQKIGFLFQSGALYDSMTVKENLEFPLRRIRKNLKKEEIYNKINDVLEQVGLANALLKMPSELSGGMRKRISLARTIVVDPMIMLYDEPTTGLDPITSGEISLLINDVQKRYKTSSIIITHDIECARQTADRIIMLENGEVYLEGSLDDFENSSDPLIKAFFNKQDH